MLSTGLYLIRINVLILIYLPNCFVINNVHIRKPTSSEWIRSIRENAWFGYNLRSTNKFTIIPLVLSLITYDLNFSHITKFKWEYERDLRRTIQSQYDKPLRST